MLHVQIGKLIYLTWRGPGLSLKIEDEGRNKKVEGGVIFFFRVHQSMMILFYY